MKDFDDDGDADDGDVNDDVNDDGDDDDDDDDGYYSDDGGDHHHHHHHDHDMKTMALSVFCWDAGHTHSDNILSRFLL